MVQQIEMGKDTKLFEIPTLSFLHKMTQKIYSPKTQVLYLHTKGVSYSQRYKRFEFVC